MHIFQCSCFFCCCFQCCLCALVSLFQLAGRGVPVCEAGVVVVVASPSIVPFNAIFVVLSCQSIKVQGSLPRFEILTLRGHVLQYRDIALARAIAVSLMARWARKRFALFFFCCFFVQGRLSGCRMSDRRVALEMGFRIVWGSIRPGRAQKPHTCPTTPAPAPKNMYGAS